MRIWDVMLGVAVVLNVASLVINIRSMNKTTKIRKQYEMRLRELQDALDVVARVQNE
jgi:hypothetical protein